MMLNVSLYVSRAFDHLLSVKCLFRSFAHFLNRVFIFFFLLVCRINLLILDISALSHKCIENIFQSCGLPFHSFNNLLMNRHFKF